jgi:hypothetical protein
MESFNIKRMNALLLRFWVEKKYSLILPVAIITLVFSVINITIINSNIHHNGLGIVFISIFGKWLFLGILVYHLHLSFSKGSGCVKTRHLHLLPASASEKFMSLMLTGFVLPFLFYIIEFYILNIIFTITTSAHSRSFSQFLFADIGVMGGPSGANSIRLLIQLLSLLIYYFIFQLFVWGHIFFKEYAVIKVIGIFYLAYSVFGFVVFQMLDAGFWIEFVEKAKRFATDSPEYYSQLSWTFFVIIFILISGLLYVSYKLFKRKEIKE